MPGPAKTPTEQLKDRGSWRGVKRGKTEPGGVNVRPTMPRWFDATAKAKWKVLIRHLWNLGVLRESDGHMLERYCDLYSEWRKLRAFVKRYGRTYKAADGVSRLRPEYRELKALPAELRRLEQQFGLSPASRANLNVTVGPQGVVMGGPAAPAVVDDKDEFFG